MIWAKLSAVWLPREYLQARNLVRMKRLPTASSKIKLILMAMGPLPTRDVHVSAESPLNRSPLKRFLGSCDLGLHIFFREVVNHAHDLLHVALARGRRVAFTVCPNTGLNGERDEGRFGE